MPEMRGQNYTGMTSGETYDGRHRIWTIDHGVNYYDMVAFPNGGPPMVTLDDWVFSVAQPITWPGYSGVRVNPGYEVSAWRGDYRRPECHTLNGIRFLAEDVARFSAFNLRILGFMVYERHAQYYGLPDGLGPPNR